MIVKGQHEPKMEWIRKDNVVECTVTHDMGFEKIEFIINGEPLVYDKDMPIYNEALTTITLPIPLKEGDNTITVKAYSREGTILERTGEITYTP